MPQELDKELLALKPKSCKFCYWWSDKKRCCERSSCYYERMVDIPPPSECDLCPYHKSQPCIGWCTRDIMREMGLLPRPKEETAWN